MAHPWHHAESTVRRWGGRPEDYIEIHSWFDESKEYFADWRHRAYRHHSEGIFECEKTFGYTIRNSDGVDVPVRLIAEQHVREDLRCIPTFKDWFSNIQSVEWMRNKPELDASQSIHAVTDNHS